MHYCMLNIAEQAVYKCRRVCFFVCFEVSLSFVILYVSHHSYNLNARNWAGQNADKSCVKMENVCSFISYFSVHVVLQIMLFTAIFFIIWMVLCVCQHGTDADRKFA